MLLFDFECSDGHRFEELVKSDVLILECPKCGKNSVRQISAPRLDYLHMGLDPALATASDRWAKMQTEKARKDKGDSTKGQNLKMY